MNLNCTTGPATRPCTSLWSQGVYRSRSFSLSSTTATARGNALTLPQFSMSMSNDADPLSRLTGDLTQRIRKMHVGASVVAALSNCPTLIQRLTHTDPLSLAVRGAYTRGVLLATPGAARFFDVPARFFDHQYRSKQKGHGVGPGTLSFSFSPP